MGLKDGMNKKLLAVWSHDGVGPETAMALSTAVVLAMGSILFRLA
jgi:hypothetical protein